MRGKHYHRSSGDGMWGYGRIALPQDRERWRALVSAVMKLQVPKNAMNFLTN